MPNTHDELLEDFRSAYWRMYLAAVHLLREGVPVEAVAAAVRGKLDGKHPGLKRVVELRDAAHADLIAAAEAGVSSTRLVEAARQARDAVQGEWNVTLPMATEV